MSKQCVKCGYVRKASDTVPDYECPKCGVIYAKIEDARMLGTSKLPSQPKKSSLKLKKSKSAYLSVLFVAAFLFSIYYGQTYGGKGFVMFAALLLIPSAIFSAFNGEGAERLGLGLGLALIIGGGAYYVTPTSQAIYDRQAVEKHQRLARFIESGNFSGFTTTLAHGISIKDSYDDLLVLSVDQGQFQITKALLDNGANPDSGKPRYSLCKAVEKSSYELAAMFLSAGANPNIKCDGLISLWYKAKLAADQSKDDRIYNEIMRMLPPDIAQTEIREWQEKERLAASSKVDARSTLDCNDLYNYGKNVRGDNWLTAGGVVANARESGKCKW